MQFMSESPLTNDNRSRIYERYASGFQDAGPTFDERGASRWGRAYQMRYLRGWLPPDPSAAILDVGCGGGRLLYMLRQLGYKNLTGVDISPEQVALARQVCPNVIECSVLEFLRDQEGAFDMVIGLDIIEHFRKEEVLRFLDLCNRALRPSGRIVLQTLNGDTPWGTVHRYGDFTHEVGFNSNSLGRLLVLAGFSGIAARETGPVVYGVKSAVRCVLWRIIRLGLELWNLAETGARGSGVYTRIFIMSATKASAPKREE